MTLESCIPEYSINGTPVESIETDFNLEISDEVAFTTPELYKNELIRIFNLIGKTEKHFDGTIAFGWSKYGLEVYVYHLDNLGNPDSMALFSNNFYEDASNYKLIYQFNPPNLDHHFESILNSFYFNFKSSIVIDVWKYNDKSLLTKLINQGVARAYNKLSKTWVDDLDKIWKGKDKNNIVIIVDYERTSLSIESQHEMI